MSVHSSTIVLVQEKQIEALQQENTRLKEITKFFLDKFTDIEVPVDFELRQEIKQLLNGGK